MIVIHITDLVFYIGIWEHRKLFLHDSWLQKILYHSLLPQPNPNLNVYEEQVSLKNYDLHKTFFLGGGSSILNSCTENKRVVKCQVKWLGKSQWGPQKHTCIYKLTERTPPGFPGRVKVRFLRTALVWWGAQNTEKSVSQFYCLLNGGQEVFDQCLIICR